MLGSEANLDVRTSDPELFQITSTSTIEGFENVSPESNEIPPSENIPPESNGNPPYVVQRGDTLQGIALRNHIKISDLKKWNKVVGQSPMMIVGEEILIQKPPMPPPPIVATPDPISAAFPASPPSPPPSPRVSPQTKNAGDHGGGGVVTALYAGASQLIAGTVRRPSKSKDKKVDNQSPPIGKEPLVLSSDETVTRESPADKAFAFFFPKRRPSYDVTDESETSITTDPSDVIVRHTPPTNGGHSATPPAAKPATPWRFFSQREFRPSLTRSLSDPLGSRNSRSGSADESTGIGLHAAITSMPRLQGESEILNDDLVRHLESILPVSTQGYQWKLLYSTTQHGAQMGTFYHRARKEQRSLMIIQTLDREIFGGFTTTSWHPHPKYFGTGESFLFTFRRFATAHTTSTSIRYFPWTAINNFVMMSTDEYIAMGGGGGAFGLLVEDDFARGTTNTCETFQNTPLSSKEQFEILCFELWGFSC